MTHIDTETHTHIHRQLRVLTHLDILKNEYLQINGVLKPFLRYKHITKIG